MGWTTGARARLRNWLRRSSAEERMEEEFRFHVEMETEANIRAGMSPEEARRRALIAFGGMEGHKEELRRDRQVPWVEPVLQDVRYAARSLRGSPGLTLTVVLTLAVGIGAASAMYGIMSRLLLRPPPHVSSPERVVKLFFQYQPSDGQPRTYAARDYGFYEAVRDRSRTLQAVAAYTDIEVPVSTGAAAVLARATVASAGFWRALGTRPALGRLFTDEEAHPASGAEVAVLGHAFWRRHYGGDPAAVGRTLRIRGHSYEIVGVAPRGFRGIELADVDLWLPISAYAEGERDSLTWHEDRGGNLLSFVGRLRPRTSTPAAEGDLSQVLHASDEGHRPVSSGAAGRPRPRTLVRVGPVVGALGSDMQPIPEARVGRWMVGIAVVLLGVSCATVASLLLLRAMRRRREIGVRLALGMSRRRLAALLFTESLLLTLMGGAAALAVAVWGGAWINRVLLPELAWEPSETLDISVLALTGLCIVGTAILTGLAPVLQARVEPAHVLRDGVQHASQRRSHLYSVLLVAQLALSVVLLVGAGLFLKSLHRIGTLDLGLDSESVLVTTVDFTGAGRAPSEVAAFYERALERVQVLPGVERASLAMTIPLRSARGGGSIQLPESAAGMVEEQGSPSVNYVTPGFFATVGTRIVQGRDFLPHERDDSPVLVINETMARVAWPGGSPIGECVPFRRQATCRTVVGVVENTRKFRLKEEESLLYYRPLPEEDADDDRVLLIRPAPGRGVTAGTIGRALQEIEAALPYVHTETLGAALDPQIRPWRLGTTVFTTFGVLSALLATVGLFSALAYTVTQRTREIGVRLAIGARGRDVMRLVLGDGLRVALIGTLTGTLACLVAGRWIADLLFEVSPADPTVLLVVTASLLLTAIAASLVPARRALRIDAITAMRTE